MPNAVASARILLDATATRATITKLGPGLEAGKFLAPHGIAIDSKGDIYIGEVGVTDWKTSFPDTPMPPEVRVSRCLQKLEKI